MMACIYKTSPCRHWWPASLLILAMGGVIAAHASAQSAPFSPVIEAGDVIYLAGHLGRDPETRELPEGIAAQTTQTLKNIGATLATVNATHADIVRCQVFLADIGDFDAMNAAYRVFFPSNPPARTTVAVKELVLDARIEIECTAVRGHASKRGDTDE